MLNDAEKGGEIQRAVYHNEVNNLFGNWYRNLQEDSIQPCLEPRTWQQLTEWLRGMDLMPFGNS